MKKKEQKKPTEKKKEAEKKKVGEKKDIWEKFFKDKKLDKGNNVAVIYLRENGNADPMVVPSKQGMFNIEGKTYHERKDCTYTVGKERYPLAIIEEWSVTPKGTNYWQEKDIQEKCAILQDHVMKGIRHAERVRMGEREGMKLNAKTIIVLAIVGIIVFAIIMSYL